MDLVGTAARDRPDTKLATSPAPQPSSLVSRHQLLAPLLAGRRHHAILRSELFGKNSERLDLLRALLATKKAEDAIANYLLNALASRSAIASRQRRPISTFDPIGLPMMPLAVTDLMPLAHIALSCCSDSVPR